jgi:hypothetical protein
MMDWRRRRLIIKRVLQLVAVVVLCVYVAGKYGSGYISESSNPLSASDLLDPSDSSLIRLRPYDDIACITEQSEEPCSFPLLTAHHRRCGSFPGSTSWLNITGGFGWARMEASVSASTRGYTVYL